MTLKEEEKKFGLPYNILEKYVSFGLVRESNTPEAAKKYLLLTEETGTDEQQISMLKRGA